MAIGIVKVGAPIWAGDLAGFVGELDALGAQRGVAGANVIDREDDLN